MFEVFLNKLCEKRLKLEGFTRITYPLFLSTLERNILIATILVNAYLPLFIAVFIRFAHDEV